MRLRKISYFGLLIIIQGHVVTECVKFVNISFEETYGEDPYLSGRLAASYVRGLQGNHERYIQANAGCKHYAAYGGPENIPESRHRFNAKVN